MYIYIYIYSLLFAGWLAWHYLSNATCLIQPRFFYAWFVTSRITITCYMIRQFWRKPALDKWFPLIHARWWLCLTPVSHSKHSRSTGVCDKKHSSVWGGWVMFFVGFLLLSTLYQNVTGMSADFTRTSPEFHQNSQELHRKFTRIHQNSPEVHRKLTEFHRNFTGTSSEVHRKFTRVSPECWIGAP